MADPDAFPSTFSRYLEDQENLGETLEEPQEILETIEEDENQIESELEANRQQISDLLEERQKPKGVEIPKSKRSLANRRLTLIELVQVLIKRAKQLQANRPLAMTKELERGSWFNKHMSDEQYQTWREKVLTDFGYAARLEYELGYLDNWEVYKEYPDGTYEVWEVRELPLLRK